LGSARRAERVGAGGLGPRRTGTHQRLPALAAKTRPDGARWNGGYAAGNDTRGLRLNRFVDAQHASPWGFRALAADLMAAPPDCP
jgi:hypothetical protein